MAYIINADDYGLTKGITDHILSTFDHGVLNSTSIISNGLAFEYAIEELKKRPDLRLSIHLNLVEGVPLLPVEEVFMLVDEHGQFFHSFQSLWWLYLTSKSKNRDLLSRQINQEIAAQIRKVTQCFDQEFKVNVDSHLHYHMIPFVFNELLSLHDEFDFKYIRLPQERFFILSNSFQSIKNYFSLNPVKQLLLNMLSKIGRQQLKEKNIASCDHFIGVLFSGKMTENVVQAALSNLTMKKKTNPIVEILFHPGQAQTQEVGVRNAHYSLWRVNEGGTLKSGSFKKLMTTYLDQH